MTFGRDELLMFLQEIDDLLDGEAALEIVGGAAAVLAYGATEPTKDIDSFSPIDERISAAAARTSLRISLDRRAGAVGDAPINYEDRRLRLDLPFRRLAIWVPERHDLLLMKTVRSSRHDDEVIEEMHKVEPFQLDLLIDRFNAEMGHVIGDPVELSFRFADVIVRLFGRAAAAKVRRKRPR